MKHTMVRYKVKPDRVAENEGLIANVFEQLRREKPSGLRYNSFKLQDGVSFVHIASHETADGSNPLTSLSAFKAFTAGIKDRCEEAPSAGDVKEVGSYLSFGE